MRLDSISQYLMDCWQFRNVELWKAASQYYLFQELPQQELPVHNPAGGSLNCRAQTTDFIYSFSTNGHRMKKQVSNMLPEYDYFFDVGACMGDFSIWMAQQGIKTFTFEPLLENYKHLLKNIKENHLEDRIESFNCGLGYKNETTQFYIHPHDKCKSGKYLEGEGAKGQEVLIRRLDDVVEALGLPFHRNFIIKIRAGKMETEILRGAIKLLSKVKKVLLIVDLNDLSQEELLQSLWDLSVSQVWPLDNQTLGLVIDNSFIYEKILPQKNRFALTT